MARKIFRDYVIRSKRGAREAYPWDTWLNGRSRWLLQQGVDFQVDLESMRVTIWRAATRRNLNVSVYNEGNGKLLLVNRGKRKREKEKEGQRRKQKAAGQKV